MNQELLTTLLKMEKKHGLEEFYRLPDDHADILEVQSIAKTIKIYNDRSPELEDGRKTMASIRAASKKRTFSNKTSTVLQVRWTKEEEKFLREQYNYLSNPQLAELLERSERSVHGKLNRLGLVREKDNRGKNMTNKKKNEVVNKVADKVANKVADKVAIHKTNKKTGVVTCSYI